MTRACIGYGEKRAKVDLRRFNAGRPQPTEATQQARALKVLAYLGSYFDENGWAPTGREIDTNVPGANSQYSTVWLRRLRDAGFVRMGVGARTIAITEAGWAKIREMRQS